MRKSTSPQPPSPMSSEPAVEKEKKPATRSRRTTRSVRAPETVETHTLPAESPMPAAVAAPASIQPVATAGTEEPRVSPGSGTPPATSQRRFDIFIVDIGWSSPVADAIRQNIDHCLRYQAKGTVYILSKEQCVELFRMHPSMIGTEPSIFFIDRDALAAKRPGGFGFKLNFGLIRDVPTANNLLKWVMAVIAEQKPGSDITEPIRTVVHKEGFRGAVDILADITRSPVGEAMTH
jgi:hypothetical protein